MREKVEFGYPPVPQKVRMGQKGTHLQRGSRRARPARERELRGAPFDKLREREPRPERKSRREREGTTQQQALGTLPTGAACARRLAPATTFRAAVADGRGASTPSPPACGCPSRCCSAGSMRPGSPSCPLHPANAAA